MTDVTLPTAKTPASLEAATAKVLVYGEPKIGKTTLVSQLDPDHTLFLACEPGLGAIEAFEMTVDSWDHFRQIGKALGDDPKHYKIIAIDPVNNLLDMCADAVCAKLNVPRLDSDNGGYTELAKEFALRISRLCSLGLGVWFIAHSKETEIKKRTGNITKVVPDMTGKNTKFLLKLVDFALYVASEQNEDGTENRVIRTTDAENYAAGGRVPLPDPLPLDAKVLRQEIDKACAALKPTAGKTGKA